MSHQLFNPSRAILMTGGAIRPSWKVSFFLTGTTTPTPVYTTSDLDVTHTQPVQADSGGVLPAIYLEPAVTYKASYYDQNDVLQYTDDPVNDQLLSQVGIGQTLWPRTAAEIAAGVTPVNYAYPPGDVQRYGAELDGVTDDTAALVAVIAQQQAGGAPVHGTKGATLLVSSWVKLTLTAPFKFDGNGMTLECANAERASFVTCEDNFEIIGTIFDGFYRVIDNPAGTGGAITEGRFTGNTCRNATGITGSINAYYLIVSNPFENVWIKDNIFEDALVTCIYLGENTYADQDDWNTATISGNTIKGVTCPSGPAAGFGILAYGRDITIEGNTVSGVEGATGSYSASNGAYGIYTKARFANIESNRVFNVGLLTNADVDQIIGINIKGSDRSDTSTPQGYATVCAKNRIRNIGVANTSGSGISTDHSDVEICTNWMDGIGRRGIFAFGPVGMAGSFLINHNTVILAAGSNENGIELAPGATRADISHNIITAGRAPIFVRTVGENGANVNIVCNTLTGGTGVRLSADTHILSNILISKNRLASGTHGLFLGTSGGGSIADLRVLDNDFDVASTAQIGGPLPADIQLRHRWKFQTTAAGPATAIELNLPDEAAFMATLKAVAMLNTGGEVGAYKRSAAVYRDGGGNATLVSTVEDEFTREVTAAWEATMDVTNTFLRARLTGEASHTINWSLVMEIQGIGA